MNRNVFVQFLFVVTFFWFGSGTVFSHDLGVVNATLEATVAPSEYRLSVDTPESALYLYSPPGIPNGCLLNKPYNGQYSEGALAFEFSCDGPLTVADSIKLSWDRSGVFLTAHWADAAPVKKLFLRDESLITVSLRELSAENLKWYASAIRYLTLGVEHILAGYDHLLFVCGIVLMVRSSALLVKTITAFTISHSITLALAFLGVINVPSLPVEACIALSIVILAYEIIRMTKGKLGLTARYPWLVAGGFGLLHGLGFAGALSELGVAAEEVPIALLFFNVGVELGQLLFILCLNLVAFVAVKASVIVGYSAVRGEVMRTSFAYCLGVIATYWVIERSFLIFGLA